MSGKKRLKDFIEENYRLLTVIGVFGGLTAFFSNIKEATFLSFCTFAMLLLLSWELMVSFPKREVTATNLKMFEALFIMLLFSLAFYIYGIYKAIIKWFVPFVISLLSAWVYAYILFEKFDVVKYFVRVTPERGRLRSFTEVVVFGSVIVIMLITAWIGSRLMPFLP